MAQREIIKKNVVRFRGELGPDVTQQDVADLSGISVYSISRYEGGGSTPDRDKIVQLARAFGRPMEDFFNPNPPPKDPTQMRSFVVRTKIVGSAPPGLQEELDAVVRRYSPGRLAAHTQTKARLKEGKKR